MRQLLKAKIRGLKNVVKNTGPRQYLLFALLGGGIVVFMGFFFPQVFGYLHHQEDFPPYFKLFIAEKLLMMVFLTLFSMQVLSALVSTLNIFFLSRDLNLLFSSPIKTGTVFAWKSVEVGINSSALVILFSLPVLFAYHYYFAPGFTDILASIFIFLLYTFSGVAAGILLGMVIPFLFSVKRLQPVLSFVSIILVSSIVVFLRLLRPEKFLNPDEIDNLFQYMGGLNIDFFSYFPFYWLSKGLGFIAQGEYGSYWKAAGLFLFVLLFLTAVIGVIQDKTYFKLFDKLNTGTRGGTRSRWKKSRWSGEWGTLWKKEVKTFIRTPAQWSQLLIIGAMVVVFILNLESIPLPHPSVKNIIAYLNLGMAAFIVAGLSSRFVFTTIPMEHPGISHVLASPFDKKKFFRFKLLFFVIPQSAIGFLLFFTGDISLRLDPFIRIGGVFFLVPALFFLTVLALFFSLLLKEAVPLTPQHLIASRQGISYMLWSLLYIVLCMVYFIRPLFLFYYNLFRKTPVPYAEISAWFLGFVFLNFLVTGYFYKRGMRLWLTREFL